jgi:O-antigen/teichoic acid export membrane protein
MSGTLLAIVVLQVLTILAGLARAKGLALLLGPAAFGVVSTIDQLVVTVVTLGAIGVPFTALKFLARAHSASATEFQRSGAGFLRLMTLLGLVAAGIATAVMTWRPDTFGADLVAHRHALAIALLGVPSAMLLMLFVNAFAAARRPIEAAGINLLAVTALGVGAVAGAWWRGIDGLYELSVLAAVLTTGLGLVHLARVLALRFDTPDAGVVGALRGDPAIVGYSLCFYATFAGIAVMMLLARTTVLSVLGAADVGRLQAAFSVALTVGAALYPLSNLYLGPLVNSHGPVAEKAHAVDQFVSRLLLLLLVGALPALLFPETLIRILFSTQFTPAAGVLWTFVLWQCVFQIAYVYQQLLIGLDDIVFAAGALILGCVVAIVLTSPLTGAMGLGGVAASLVAGMLLWGVLVAVRLGTKHATWSSPRLVARLAIVLLIVAASGYAFARGSELTARGILARLATAGVVALFCVFSLDARERDPRRWIAALRPGT